MEYLWLIAGFALLVVGADIFVEGSSALAKLFKIPSIIIGLTIVAFGTSLPEASVSISAAISGQNDIAISNVLGSNIFNIVFILGASAVISPVTIDITALYDTIILFFVSIVGLIFAITKKNFSRLEGAALLGIYGAYFTYILMREPALLF